MKNEKPSKTVDCHQHIYGVSNFWLEDEYTENNSSPKMLPQGNSYKTRYYFFFQPVDFDR